MSRLRGLLLAGTVSLCTLIVTPAPAAALDPIGAVCGAVGLVSGLAGKACKVVQHGGQLLTAGKKLVTGHVGGAVKALVGGGTTAIGAASAVAGLAAVGAWVLVGAKAALDETVTVIDRSTAPRLTDIWFSATYWRVAALAALLTLPFLFAAGVQALMRSDLSLLLRAAFGHLPLAMLAIGIAAPLTMLLLGASDEMSALVSSAAGGGGTRFLRYAGSLFGGASVLFGSPFLAVAVGLIALAAALTLTLELLIREAAVYVVVLMLPLAFAAMVWPARRIWALRASELLMALILSKFAIVAVLALAGAALGHIGESGAAGMLAGAALLALATFTPWALLRLLPMAEMASGTVGSLRAENTRARAPLAFAFDDGALPDAEAGGANGRPRPAPEPPGQGAQGELSKLDDGPPGGARAGTGAITPDEAAARSDGYRDPDEALVLAGFTAAPGPASTRGADASIDRVGRLDADRSAQSDPGHEPAPAAQGPPQPERSPDMEAPWQAPDLSWRPLLLEPAGEFSSGPFSGSGYAGDDIGSDSPSAPASAADGPHSAPDDVIPPPQAPEDGRL
ncbi:MAG: hypothetical protein ACYC91_13960 [Solirubrobacteraceae bacterium]